MQDRFSTWMDQFRSEVAGVRDRRAAAIQAPRDVEIAEAARGLEHIRRRQALIRAEKIAEDAKGREEVVTAESNTRKGREYAIRGVLKKALGGHMHNKAEQQEAERLVRTENLLLRAQFEAMDKEVWRLRNETKRDYPAY